MRSSFAFPLLPSYTLPQTIAVAATGCQPSGVDANHFDLSAKYAGMLYSISNTIGTIPGIVGVYLSGWMLEKTGDDWSLVFMIASFVAFVGWFAFVFLARGTAVDFDTRGVGCCGAKDKEKTEEGNYRRRTLY